jgi:hypothetical protein
VLLLSALGAADAAVAPTPMIAPAASVMLARAMNRCVFRISDSPSCRDDAITLCS